MRQDIYIRKKFFKYKSALKKAVEANVEPNLILGLRESEAKYKAELIKLSEEAYPNPANPSRIENKLIGIQRYHYMYHVKLDVDESIAEYLSHCNVNLVGDEAIECVAEHFGDYASFLRDKHFKH